jgi:sodium/proline symporter
MTLVSFLFFLLVFIAIGLYSVKHKKRHVKDYYVASREISPTFVALSAVTSMCSGFMFFGYVGMAYKMGFSFSWWAITAFIGMYAGYYFFLEKFTKKAQNLNCSTFVQVLSKGTGNYYRYVSIIAGLIAFIFLSVGCSGQLMAGAKAFNSMYEFDIRLSGFIVITIVLLYCYAGGIRASIWTDVAQSIVMAFSMAALAFMGVYEIGGFSNLVAELKSIDPNLVSMEVNKFGGWKLYAFSWLIMHFASSIALPYVMVRHLTNKSTEKSKKVLNIYCSYQLAFFMFASLIGFSARVLLTKYHVMDVEYALLSLTKLVFNDVMVGVMLAGIFAGIISTADSLVLVCSSTITKDLFPKLGNKYSYAKLSTLLVAILVYFIFLTGSKSVFSIVMFSVTAMACAFGPVIMLYLNGKKPKEITVILMMVTAIVSILLWRGYGLHQIANEAILAFPITFIVYFVSEFINKRIGENK